MVAVLTTALLGLPLAAHAAALLGVHGKGLVTHGAVDVRVIVGHAVVVRGGVCDDAHEEGSQRGIVDEGKQEGGVHGEA